LRRSWNGEQGILTGPESDLLPVPDEEPEYTHIVSERLDAHQFRCVLANGEELPPGQRELLDLDNAIALRDSLTA
jgi:hypothetical protein